MLPQHTDHAGVMWHGAYVNWLEEGRVKALAEVGFAYEKISFKGFEMPVVTLAIDYKKSLKHGEEVFVDSWSLPQKGVRYPWRTIFVRTDGDIVAESLVELVLVKKVPSGTKVLRCVPDEIAVALMKLQCGPTS